MLAAALWPPESSVELHYPAKVRYSGHPANDRRVRYDCAQGPYVKADDQIRWCDNDTEARTDRNNTDRHLACLHSRTHAA